MKMTNIETMKLALEALKDACGERCNAEYNPCFQREAITAIEKCLANDALEKKAENARELGLDYEPCGLECDCTDVCKQDNYKALWQQMCERCDELDKQLAQQAEPVAWMHTMDNTEGHKANKPYVLFTKSKRNPFGVAGRDYSKSYPVTKQPLYTSPPVATNDTSQERVDETAKQRHWVGLTEAQCGVLWKTNMTPFEYYKAIEAKLKEKNT
jgi:hypothetical protein